MEFIDKLKTAKTLECVNDDGIIFLTIGFRYQVIKYVSKGVQIRTESGKRWWTSAENVQKRFKIID